MNNSIKPEVQTLIKHFHIIASKKWIKSINKSLGSIGNTFENELGKNPDSLYFPDYYGTEIKCTGRFSRYPITLFTTAFDGPTFPEIERLIDKYGYPDLDYPDKKVLFLDVGYVSEMSIQNGYKFRLEVDDLEEKVYLCVYNVNDVLIEKKSFVYFKTLCDHLTLKLNRLAVVYASKKLINNEKHFRYYKINIFELKNFNKFIELLKNGTIKVKLISRISKSGSDTGRYRNKNLVFMLKKTDIIKLFNEIYSYDYDGVRF